MSHYYIIHGVLLSNVAVTVVQNLVVMHSWKQTALVSETMAVQVTAPVLLRLLNWAKRRMASRADKHVDWQQIQREDTGKQGAGQKPPLLVFNISPGDGRPVPHGQHPAPSTQHAHLPLLVSALQPLSMLSCFCLVWFIINYDSPYFFLCCSSATCTPECHIWRLFWWGLVPLCHVWSLWNASLGLVNIYLSGRWDYSFVINVTAGKTRGWESQRIVKWNRTRLFSNAFF